MRVITDSAADFTNEELQENDIHCVRTQVMFGEEAFMPGVDLSEEVFWQRLMAGENAKTSQPSPQTFLSEFEEARQADEEAVCICVSSALSGTIQSATLAASMAESDKIHIVDSLGGAAAQKLLVMYACRLRDEGKLAAQELIKKLEEVRSRIRLLACVDTLENLGRSGRIPKAVANLGNIAQLKPILEVSPDGRIVMGGKAIGRRRALDALSKKIASFHIDKTFPIIPLYSYQKDNCLMLLKKLREMGIQISEELMSAIGTAIAPHIGPNAYGVAFVAAE